MSAIVTQRLATARSEREFKRKKLEELFLAVHKYCTVLSLANLAWPDVAQGKIEYKQALDSFIKQDRTEYRGQYELSQMLIQLYFPQLQTDFDKILEVRKTFTILERQLREQHDRGGSISEFSDKFNAALILIEKANEAFKKKVSVVASKIK